MVNYPCCWSSREGQKLYLMTDLYIPCLFLYICSSKQYYTKTTSLRHDIINTSLPSPMAWWCDLCHNYMLGKKHLSPESSPGRSWMYHECIMNGEDNFRYFRCQLTGSISLLRRKGSKMLQTRILLPDFIVSSFQVVVTYETLKSLRDNSPPFTWS